LLLFVELCWCLFLFVDICWYCYYVFVCYLLRFVLICWHLLICIDVCCYLLIFVDSCWSPFMFCIFVDIFDICWSWWRFNDAGWVGPICYFSCFQCCFSTFVDRYCDLLIFVDLSVDICWYLLILLIPAILVPICW